MKTINKILWIVYFAFISAAFTFSDEIIHTPEGDKTVIIPTDFNNLKLSYLKLATIYWSQHYDLGVSLADNKKLLSDKTVLESQIDKNTLEISDLVKRLSITQKNYDDAVAKYNDALKNKILYQSFIKAGVGYNIINNTPIVILDYQGIILSEFSIDIQLQYPFAIEALLGIKL